MMDRTDRHFRYFLRQISRHTLLYTEMVTTGAILHGDQQRHLDFDPAERPLALQLGGDDPQHLAECAHLAQEWGYDEVNLNVGCPSDRVQRGRIGACLMAEPQVVADAVFAMRQRVAIPVTVKHRIGIDHLDRYEDMLSFVDTVAAADCDRFTVHARIAVLQGLSPKQNRQVPPLRYSDVYRLKRERPQLGVEINGGVKDLTQTADHLQQVDAVMIGRAAYDNPYLFANADQLFFPSEGRKPEPAPPSRREVLEHMVEYVGRLHRQGTPIARITRHLLQLFAGQPGARLFRRHLSENAHLPGSGPEVLVDAMAKVPPQVLDAKPDSSLPAGLLTF